MNISSRTAAAVLVAACSFVAPASADRVLSGPEAQKLLAGQSFDFFCVDGTRGEASYAQSGVATASYRLPSAPDDAAMLKDRGRVRSEGANVCIHWNNLNAGEEGCFRMSEREPGKYRIATADRIRWCELSTRGSS